MRRHAAVTVQRGWTRTTGWVGALLVFALAAVLPVPAEAAALPVAAAPTPYPAVAASGSPSVAAVGTLWGKPTVGGAYGYPFGTGTRTETGTGLGDKGLLRMKPAGRAAVSLPSVIQRDVAINSSFNVERLGASAVKGVGTGVYFAVQARRVGQQYYRAIVQVQTNGSATLSVDRFYETDSSKTAFLEKVPLGTLTVGKQYRLEFEVEGASVPSLRARLYASGGSAPEWQIQTTDNGAHRLSAPGYIGFWGLTASNTNFSSVRVSAFVARTIVDGQAQASGYGAPALGSTTYPVPADRTKVIWVDPKVARTADDWKPGEFLFDAQHEVVGETIPCNRKPTKKLPLAANRTVASLSGAIKQANDGDTIIVKGGVYHEQITVCEGKRFTIQPENGAKVWLDGSRALTGWTKAGTRWSAPWSHRFDGTPGDTWGGSDSTSLGWQFVNSAYPMAAQPEQVYLDGVQLTQVSTLAAVTASSFYFDRTAGRIYIGADPANRAVRSSDLQFAFFAATSFDMRGIGIRNYATSGPQQAAISFHGGADRGQRLTDLIVEDNAVGGVQISKPGTVLTNVTLRYNGRIGGGSSQTSDLTLSNVSATNNNTEWFNRSPAAGGFKATRNVNRLVVRNSEFSDNYAAGLWLDENVTNFTLASNNIERNSETGLTVELSDGGAVVNNVIRNNVGVKGRGAPHNVAGDSAEDAGLFLLGTSNTKIWNNTVTGNYRAVIVRKDSRVWDGRTFPATGNSLRNNIIAGTASSLNPWCAALCVEDKTRTVTGAELVVDIQGNAFHRPTATTPTYVVGFPKKAGNTIQYFRTLTEAGIDPLGRELTGALPVQANGKASVSLQSQAGATFGSPVDSSIAALTTGTRSPLVAGTRTIGAVRP